VTLADQILPLVRSRTDLHRWRAANAYGIQLHDAVTLLLDAAENEPPAEVLAVTQKAIASACKVIMRADDSSGIIGNAIRQLLGLHAQLARVAPPPYRKLVDWMIRFQFECDYFEIDPVAYAPALGERGLAAYRAKLDEIAAGLSPKLSDEQQRNLWSTDRAAWSRRVEEDHTRFVLEWNDRRLAVWDKDVDAIIVTHSRDRKVAVWLEETAKAMAEIGEFDLAIDWARQATWFDLGHQAAKASGYWCTLLATHRPDDELPALLDVFRRWPTSSNASTLHQRAAASWPTYADEVMATLERRPREAVSFALYGLDDLALAWTLAHSLALDDSGLWQELAKRYETVEPLAVLPIHRDLALADLEHADAGFYRSAARRLARMRRLASDSPEAADVDELIADLRETHRRRPRLQLEFDRAGLP
jgi:hypothetical protein